jgi:hypothetical protein
LKSTENITHSVILSVRPDMPFQELFERLFYKLTTEDDKTIYRIECTHLDSSHPIYLDVTARWPHTGLPLKLLIPHSLVLLVLVGSQFDEKQFGFHKA